MKFGKEICKLLYGKYYVRFSNLAIFLVKRTIKLVTKKLYL